MGPESKNEDYTLCLDGMPIAWREPLPEITVREEGVEELAIHRTPSTNETHLPQ